MNDIFSLENENHIILPKDVKMSQDIHVYLNKTNFYVECMHWDKNGILDGLIDHKQNMYPKFPHPPPLQRRWQIFSISPPYALCKRWLLCECKLVTIIDEEQAPTYEPRPKLQRTIW